MRVAVQIVLVEAERAALVKWSRGRSTPARLVLRAKVVLAAAEGRENKDIAEELGGKRETVGRWRNRFASLRLSGIEKDASRSGPPATVRSAHEVEIIRRTTQELPCDATQWSVRSMAASVGFSKDTVRRVWRDNGLKPHLVKTFKVSNDPQFAEKLVDVVGLYLSPGPRTQTHEGVLETSESLPLPRALLSGATPEREGECRAVDRFCPSQLPRACSRDLFTRRSQHAAHGALRH